MAIFVERVVNDRACVVVVPGRDDSARVCQSARGFAWWRGLLPPFVLLER